MILIDTREQRPIQFDRSRRVTLVVGDYTTRRHLNKLHLERKSPGDLYGTVLRGHKRFRREILRAKDNGIKLVVLVECSRHEFFAMKWSGAQYCKFPPETLKRIITTMGKKYQLKFIWCANRRAMKETILKLLK